MTVSYRLIGTYNSDSLNLGDWGGPVSGTAFTAAGTSTTWGSTFGVSNFNVGAGFGTGSTDVLNSGGYGYDELDVDALLAATSNYSVSNAAVFNWSPGNPGFGCDTFAVSTNSMDGHLIYSDTLSSSAWGEVIDYEMSVNMSPYWDDGSSSVAVSGFQVTNIQLTSSVAGGGATNVTASNVQAGTFDLSDSYAANLTVTTAANASQGSTQTYVVLAGHVSSAFYGEGLEGDTVTVSNGTQTADFAGSTLTTDGSTSLMDFFDNGGGNTVNLSASLISSNLYLNGTSGGHAASGGGSMSFLASYSSTTAAQSAAASGGCDVVTLNTSGTGDVSHIFTSDTGGVTWVNGFVIGRDTLDMTVVGSGGAGGLASLSVGSGTATLVQGTSATNGVVLASYSVASLTSHMTTAMVSGVEHLYIH